MSKTNILELYDRQGEKLFEDLYRNERSSFIHWAKKAFSCDKEEALDVFQESIMVLYHKLNKRDLVELNASLKTYVFAIGRNILLKKFRQSKRMKLADFDLPDIPINLAHYQPELDDRQQQLSMALDKLGESCRRVLTLFYYKRFSIEAIQQRLNYNSEEVVRSKKYRCLQQLKNIIVSNESLI